MSEASLFLFILATVTLLIVASLSVRIVRPWALAYFESGNVREARRAVLRALERAPNFEKALDLLLEVRSQRGEVDRP